MSKEYEEIELTGELKERLETLRTMELEVDQMKTELEPKTRAIKKFKDETWDRIREHGKVGRYSFGGVSMTYGTTVTKDKVVVNVSTLDALIETYGANPDLTITFSDLVNMLEGFIRRGGDEKPTTTYNVTKAKKEEVQRLFDEALHGSAEKKSAFGRDMNEQKKRIGGRRIK